MANLLEKANILITPTSYSDGKIHSAKPIQSLGVELVTNGDFATDTNWTKEIGWSIADGKAIKIGTVASNFAQLNTSVFTSNKTYKITFNISNSNDGRLLIYIGGNSVTIDITNATNGAHTFYVKADGENYLVFRNATSGFQGSIDNISVKEIIDSDLNFTRGSSATRVNAQGLIENVDGLGSELVSNGDFATDTDWAKGTGWTISGGVANASAATGLIFQNFTGLVVGKMYKAEVDVKSYTSGGLQLKVGNDSYQAINNSLGIQTLFFTASTTGGAIFVPTSAYTGSISNVSVKEVIDVTNIPRINYTDGVGSILLEPQSTNLIPYSEDLTQGSANRLLLTSNAGTSPDGTNTADKLIPNNTNSAYHYFAFSGLTISTNNVYSVFLKKSGYEYALISFETNGLSGSSDKALINLNNGTIEQSDTETKVDDYGNGWYRCSIKATSARASVAIYPLPSASLGSFTGDNTSGIIAWGLQLEQQSYATSYIPTSGSVHTRLAETASRSGLGDLIDSTEGVLYAEISKLANISGAYQLSLSNGSDNENIKILYLNTSTVRLESKMASGSDFVFDISVNDLDFNKFAIQYKANDYKVFYNGLKQTVSQVASTPIGLNKLSFDRGDGASYFYGNIKALAVLPILTDEELECLTTR